MFNAGFFERHDVVVGFSPSDLDSGSNRTDATYVSMAGYSGIAVIFTKNAGLAGNEPKIRLRQARNSTGLDHKHLNWSRAFIKVSQFPDIHGDWTQIHADAAEPNTYTLTDLGNRHVLFGVWISEEDLDGINGYTHFNVLVTDPGDVPHSSYNFRGVWSSSVTYDPEDLVSVTTNLWIATAENTNSRPTANNNNWEAFTGTPAGQYGTVLYIGTGASHIGQSVTQL